MLASREVVPLSVGPIHLLLVDDDPTMHRLFGRMLPATRYVVHSAYSAATAIDLLQTIRPHLVILDVMMPQASGLTVCSYLRGRPALRDIPVLVLSARDSQEDRLHGLSHGADDYIGKPFHLQHLVRKIEYLVT